MFVFWFDAIFVRVLDVDCDCFEEFVVVFDEFIFGNKFARERVPEEALFAGLIASFDGANTLASWSEAFNLDWLFWCNGFYFAHILYII